MNSYPVNPENAIEMARLLNQHVLLSTALSGVLTDLPSTQMARLHDVLDLACGPGGWVLEVARTYPHMMVTGIDVSSVMIEYGRSIAQSQVLQNARFMTMNVYEPLEFPDNSFDLVNGRLLSSILKRETWPVLLRETLRICRSGGIIRLADGELPATSSSALAQLLQIVANAFFLSGRGFSSDGKTLAVTSQLKSLLQDAGFHNIQETAKTLDFSANSPLHTGFYQDVLSAFQVLKPFFIGLSLIKEVNYHLLYQQMLIEISAPDFHATCDALIATGEKPVVGPQ